MNDNNSLIRSRRLIAAICLGATLLLGIATIPFYPFLKAEYARVKGSTTQTFLDVTEQALLARHHSGAPWLGTFSASTTDFDCAGPDFSGHEFGVKPCQEKGAWNAE